MLDGLRRCGTPGRQVFMAYLHLKADVSSGTEGHHGAQRTSDSFGISPSCG